MQRMRRWPSAGMALMRLLPCGLGVLGPCSHYGRCLASLTVSPHRALATKIPLEDTSPGDPGCTGTVGGAHAALRSHLHNEREAIAFVDTRPGTMLALSCTRREGGSGLCAPRLWEGPHDIPVGSCPTIGRDTLGEKEAHHAYHVKPARRQPYGGDTRGRGPWPGARTRCGGGAHRAAPPVCRSHYQ